MTDTALRESEEAREAEFIPEPPMAPPPRRVLGPPPDPPDPPDGPTGHRPRRPGRVRRAAAATAAALALMSGGYGIRAITSSGSSASATTSAAASSTAVTTSAGTGDVAALVKQAEKAVVRITSQVTRQATPFSPAQSGEAVGTGFVVASNGLILTNYHVVEGAQRITVSLGDGKLYAARVVKADSSGDLAVLKIDATGLSTLALGSSSQALAGESVVAIGYALGLAGSPTVTTGIVSSTGRTLQVQDDGAPGGPVIRTYQNVLQISAAINSGNSGGPLLDLQGRVIGINTAGSQSAQNIGFAIPIDQAKALFASAM